jgi:hypothetical protein
VVSEVNGNIINKVVVYPALTLGRRQVVYRILLVVHSFVEGAFGGSGEVLELRWI